MNDVTEPLALLASIIEQDVEGQVSQARARDALKALEKRFNSFDILGTQAAARGQILTEIEVGLRALGVDVSGEATTSDLLSAVAACLAAVHEAHATLTEQTTAAMRNMEAAMLLRELQASVLHEALTKTMAALAENFGATAREVYTPKRLAAIVHDWHEEIIAEKREEWYQEGNALVVRMREVVTTASPFYGGAVAALARMRALLDTHEESAPTEPPEEAK